MKPGADRNLAPENGWRSILYFFKSSTSDRTCLIPAIPTHPNLTAPGTVAEPGKRPCKRLSPQTTVDADAVRAAKQEIQGLVQEIADLSRSDVAAEEFYDALLNKVVQALAAVGGAVWIARRDGWIAASVSNQHSRYEPAKRSGRSNAARPAPGRRSSVMARERSLHRTPAPVAPRKVMKTPPANPTDFLLILSPVHNDQGPKASSRCSNGPVHASPHNVGT